MREEEEKDMGGEKGKVRPIIDYENLLKYFK